MMVNTNDFKTGLTIEFEGNLYSIIEFMHAVVNKTAFVRAKIKNLRTGAITERTFNPGVKIARAIIDKDKMSYLYQSGNFYVFMNSETYEQIEIPMENLKDSIPFLVEGLEVEVMQFKGEVLGVSLPDKITLTITNCDPAVKGDTKTNALKDAILETGHKIKVPMFIEEGERVVVSTSTGEYVSREK